MRVRASFLHAPIQFDAGHSFYALIMDDGCDYTSAKQPVVRDATGKPFLLADEFGAGAVVRLHVDGSTMRGVQVIEECYRNPFAEAA